MTPAPELEQALAEQVGADAAAAHGRVLDALVDAGLPDQPDPDAIRAEAREQADLRARWIRDEPEVLHDAWAQPYVVLTAARLLWAAEFGTVKADAARWVAAHVAPELFRELLLAAIRDRRTAASSTTNRVDPALVEPTRAFVAWATRETAERARRRRDDTPARSGADRCGR